MSPTERRAATIIMLGGRREADRLAALLAHVRDVRSQMATAA